MPDGIESINGSRPPPEANYERSVREEEYLRELEEQDRERERVRDDIRGQNIDTYA